jgi:hypothetical protein
MPIKVFSHSTQFSGKGYLRSAKPSGSEDLDIEEPVACWHAPAFHLHPTLAGMQGAALIGHQVVQVSQVGEKRLLAPTRVMKAFHGEQFPLDGVMRLIEQRARDRHLRVGEDRIPPCLLVVELLSDALTVGRPSRGSDMVSKAPQPLAEGKHPQAHVLACPVPQGVELGA